MWEARREHRSGPTSRVEKSLFSRGGAYFLTERESSGGAGENPGEVRHRKVDLVEGNAFVPRKGGV